MSHGRVCLGFAVPITPLGRCLLLRYSKAFELEPSLHAGINAAVLLVASGHRFDTSLRLQQIGAPRPALGPCRGLLPSGG